MLSVIVPDLGLLSRWRDAARLAAEVEVVDRDSIFDGMLQEAIATPEIQDEVQSQPVDVTELKESAWESSDELWRSAAEKVRLVEELEDQLRAVQRELLRDGARVQRGGSRRDSGEGCRPGCTSAC